MSQKTALVSIIIPTYKRTRFIERAIDSALNQTHNNIEVIVVDDNGDGTPDREAMEKIMARYVNNPCVIYKKHKQNLNGASARNTGIAAAKGDFVTFLDDDDFFLKDRIEQLVHKISNTKYDCAYTNVIKISGNRVKSLERTPGSGNFATRVLAQRPFLGTGSNMFFRASTLKELGGFDTSFKRNQDLEIMVRFFREHEILKVKNYSVVKDESDRTNASNIDTIIKTREYFLDTFNSDISKIGHRKYIYKENYQSLINSIAKYGDNVIMRKNVINKAKSEGINNLAVKRFTSHFIVNTLGKIRNKCPRSLFLNASERASLSFYLDGAYRCHSERGKHD